MEFARTRALRLVALALGGLLAATPCAGGAAEPFAINVIIPLTGAAAFLGKEESQALTALQDTVNKSGGIQGRPIAFAIRDDQSSPAIAVQLLNDVLALKPAVVLGSSFTATCNAMAAIVEKTGPVNYCFSPGVHPPPGSWVFSASSSTGASLMVTAKYFKAKGWKRVATITSTDATGQDADHGIDAAFETKDSGETIVDREHFNPSDVSVAAQMAHIGASGADALIAWSTGTPFATLLRGVGDAGLKIPVITTPGNLTYLQMKAYAPFMISNLYFPAFPFVVPNAVHDRAVRHAVDTFWEAFKPLGVRPDVGQSLAWDPALLVIDAYKHLGLDATPAQLKDYLSQTGKAHTFVGVYGKYDFPAVPQRGLDIGAVQMVRWDPAQDAFVAAVW
jgi:branched-chain amino acid transport system substrate-binding protein